jgi:hypothetical protein
VHRRAAWVWAVAVLAAAVTWAAPAGAAQISGSLQVTDTTVSSVTVSFTVKRTCGPDEQCDYFSEIDQLADTSPCPAAHPTDPWWILWTGQVQNAGPTTEGGPTTPRGWGAPAPAAPSRLCLYTYADDTYYLVADTVITRPSTGGGGTPPGGDQTPGGSPPGGGSGGTSKPGGQTSPGSTACKPYTYQQTAQKALEKDPKLASKLDPDGNGVACESLPKRKTYISTVSLREATKATRAALRKARGTAFTKGTGYHARCKRTTRIRVRCAVTWRHGGKWSGYVDVIGALRKNKRVTVTHVHVIRPF